MRHRAGSGDASGRCETPRNWLRQAAGVAPGEGVGGYTK